VPYVEEGEPETVAEADGAFVPPAQPEPEPAPVTEAEPDPEPFVEAELEPEPAAESESEAVAQAQPETPARAQPETPARAQPETLAQAQPEPQPIVLPVTITLEAEPWFDFDRSVVRADARDKLDKLVHGLDGVEYDSILVVGHADRIGSQSYNERLSMQRATSVRDYLVKQGVPSDKIQAEGRGEFEPSNDPGVCGAMSKLKLIECLQPDRRVEVTVTGQKQP
jgi:OOP family OmpA-OmpF porin